MIRKLNLASTLAALILFFLPWIDIQCSGQQLATQSGLQTIYGGASVSENMAAGPSAETEATHSPESLGFAPLTGIALILVILGVFFSFRAVLDQWRTDTIQYILPSVALLLLAVQLLIGFPAKEKIAEALAEKPEASEASDGFGEIGEEMARLMFINFRFTLTPFFYLELVALGFPALILVNRWLDKHKREAPEHQQAPREDRMEDIYFK